MEMLSSRHIKHGRMPMLTNRIFHRRPGDSGDRLFAGRIDIGDIQDIGGIESRAKLVSERLRPRIAMRLEHHHHPIPTHSPRHGQSRFYLGGMMSVIVKDLSVFILEFRLEAATRSAESGQCPGYMG